MLSLQVCSASALKRSQMTDTNGYVAPTHRLVLVEDDEKLSQLIKQYLEKHEFIVTLVPDGAASIPIILSDQPDIVILDLMLPGKDGFSVFREVRSDFTGRILFLTASDDLSDHVAGVEMGADDFLVKPVNPRVLLAHIRMLLRRTGSVPTASVDAATPSSQQPPAKNLEFGGLNIKRPTRSVTLKGNNIVLSSGEFELLWLLGIHSEEVLSRDFLYKTLRGVEYDGLDRSIDSKIAILRKKLGDNASMPTRILTVRGKGYLFVPDSWD